MDSDLSIDHLIDILMTTPSPVSLIKHSPTFGMPHYCYEAGGNHDPPYTSEEEDAMIEAKKFDPPSVDEVFDNLYLGNKGAAENTDYLMSKGITHVLNLANDLTTKYFVAPDQDAYLKHGIELKQLKLRDKAEENITLAFSETGRWIRRSLSLPGARVMVNCWQGASRSATVVLAFLMQHHDMDLMTALKMVKTKRDIRPNNGFLKQLVLLENTLLNGINGNLINLHCDTGRKILETSVRNGTSKFSLMEKYFGKQTYSTFCGVQSCCIILNTINGDCIHKENSFWSDNKDMEGLIAESTVKKQGMTLDQLTSVLNSFEGVSAFSYYTDSASVDTFRNMVVETMNSSNQQMLINYHMEVLGQLMGLGGHISPLAGYCAESDRVLLMDVWWETRPCWVKTQDMWQAMDTLDKSSSKKRGFVVVKSTIY